MWPRQGAKQAPCTGWPGGSKARQHMAGAPAPNRHSPSKGVPCRTPRHAQRSAAWHHIRMRSCFVLSAQPPVRCLDLASGASHSARTRTTRGNCSPSCSSLELPCGLRLMEGRERRRLGAAAGHLAYTGRRPRMVWADEPWRSPGSIPAAICSNATQLRRVRLLLAPEQAVGPLAEQPHPHGARLAGRLGQSVHQRELELHASKGGGRLQQGWLGHADSQSMIVCGLQTTARLRRCTRCHPCGGRAGSRVPLS